MLEEVIKKFNVMHSIIVFIASIAIIGIWRGAWNLMDKYLLPKSFLISQIFSITLGFLILIIIALNQQIKK
jgi:4-amino-4-deoxy-L-arabinose transferase-like glycosyltransferase